MWHRLCHLSFVPYLNIITAFSCSDIFLWAYIKQNWLQCWYASCEKCVVLVVSYLKEGIVYGATKYTMQSKSFRTNFFKNWDTRGRHFFIQNKFHCDIYRLLHGRTVSENLPKIPLFRPSLIHQLRLLWSEQYLENGVLLASFSTLEGENSLMEINLYSMGGGGRL